MSLIFGLTSTGLVVPVRVDANGNIQTISTGLVNGSPQRNPILFGYSGDWTEEKSNLNAAVGFNTLDGTVVPNGEIWYLQAAHVYDANSVTATMLISAVINGLPHYLAYGAAFAAGQPLIFNGMITLSQGDRVQGIFTGAVAGDDIYLGYHAVRVDIDQ